MMSRITPSFARQAMMLVASESRATTARVSRRAFSVAVPQHHTVAEQKKTKERVEKGILFSAPCLDERFQRTEEEASEANKESEEASEANKESEEASEANKGSDDLVRMGNGLSVQYVEKGVLFSAPCLDERFRHLKEDNDCRRVV